jgi:hypothetical protein
MMEVLRSPETSVLTRGIRRSIPEDIYFYPKCNLIFQFLTFLNTYYGQYMAIMNNSM